MNFKKARELMDSDGKGTDKWHYTNYNDNQDRTQALGYCRDHEGHDTPEEACDCYKRFLQDHETRLDAGEYDGWILCKVEGCAERTGKFAQVGHSHYVLCDAHRNMEVLKTMVSVGESWGSY